MDIADSQGLKADLWTANSVLFSLWRMTTYNDIKGKICRPLRNIKCYIATLPERGLEVVPFLGNFEVNSC